MNWREQHVTYNDVFDLTSVYITQIFSNHNMIDDYRLPRENLLIAS